ncbi:MAG: hypothetical protein L0206_21735, partial [Actinobacteria bacterium]|nr:hypothetical protein [Actinomycetota bacterium]
AVVSRRQPASTHRNRQYPPGDAGSYTNTPHSNSNPRAALRYQHATAKRDEAIADGIDRILEAAQHDDESGSNVIRLGGRADE